MSGNPETGLVPTLPAETLARLGDVAQVPPERRESFDAHALEAFGHAAGYLAWSEVQRHPMLPSTARMRATAAALRATAKTLKALDAADAYALMGHRAHEPQLAAVQLAAHLDGLAERASAAAGKGGRPAARPTVAGVKLLTAAEWLLFELYRAAALNGGALGLDKRRDPARGTILDAWQLIQPHTSLQRPKLDAIERLITAARRDLGEAAP